MELRVLQYFLAVAEEGSLSGAAVLCCRERGLRKGAPGRLIDDLRLWLDGGDALKA